MARRKPDAPAPLPEGHVPLFDPAVHTQPTQVVFAELYCACGSLWRQRDPVAYLAPMVADWIRQHAGDGHGPVSKAECVTEREARREAAFRVAGQHEQYAPKEHPHLDTTCTKDRPWPVFPDEAAVAAVEG